MMRYILLDLAFLAVALIIALIWRKRLAGSTPRLFKITLFLLVLTLVFDNIIILLHIVDYNSEHLSGLYVYKAPLEDFAYTLAAVLLIPALWEED